VFKGSITLIEGELYPTSSWLLDAVSCVHALCRNDGQLLNVIVKNDHDVDLSNIAKIKKSCQFVVEKIKEVTHNYPQMHLTLSSTCFFTNSFFFSSH
jgi:hypothetical protein